MLTLAGYTPSTVLASGKDAELVRATRDGQDRLLWILARELPSARDVAKLRYGHELGKELHAEGLLRSEAVIQEGGRVGLVLELFEGRTLRALLDEDAVGHDLAVDVALAVARTLGELHRHGIIHNAVAPANILVDPASGRVKLANLDHATRHAAEGAPAVALERLDAGLVYASPEQTGRMNRGVDHRTDFYSLGVVLYEMLAGRPPFRSADPMTLVHAHLAVEPRPVHEHALDVSSALSSVVQKLLAKDAEDRYQSADGLIADLRICRAELEGGGPLSARGPFVAGERDVSAEFRVPQKLYGRDVERRQVLDAFERVRRGAAELLLVTGPSGIGKSSLVKEMQAPLVEQRGYLCSGKFDQMGGAPYGAFIQAFADLVRQILAEPEARVASFREALLDSLGEHAPVVVDVLPDVALVIGPQPPVSPLGPTETQNRFNLAFQRFVEVFAHKEHPLCVFLDDLQWADAGSLHLLALLMGGAREGRALCLVGAYRDNEVDAAHPLAVTVEAARKGGAAVTEVAVRPLDPAQVAQLVADALHYGDPAACAPLAAFLHERTEGNPLFARQFLGSLHGHGLFTLDREARRFTWDIDAIRAADITDSVAGLMAERIRMLGEGAQRALRVAACVGDRFALADCAAIDERDPRAVARELWDAVERGLVVPIGDAYKQLAAEGPLPDVRYRFIHDRVREVAAAELPELERQHVHLRHGRNLLARTPEARRDEAIFQIVNQLDAALPLVTDRNERLELSRLNLAAGVKAKASTAYGSALRYLGTGVALLGDDPLATHFDLGFELLRERAACDYLVGNLDAAAAALERLFEVARDRDEKAAMYDLRASLLATRAEQAAHMRVTMEALRLYGVDFPVGEAVGPAIGAQMAAMGKNLAGRTIASLVDLPEGRDPEHLSRLRLLAQLSHGAVGDPATYQLVSLLILNLSIEHGNGPFSSLAYVSGGLVAAAQGDYEAAQAFGDVAVAVSARYDPPAARAATDSYVGGFIRPWSRSLAECDAQLERAYVVNLGAGAIWFGTIAALNRIFADVLHGAAELPDLAARAQQATLFAQRNKQDAQAVFTAGMAVAATLLADGALPAGASLFADEAEARARSLSSPMGTALYAAPNLIAAFVRRDLADARRLVTAGEPCLMALFGHFGEAIFRLFQALTYAALWAEAGAEERASMRATIDAQLPRMAVWARTNPPVFAAMEVLVRAEIARIDGDDERAAERYEEAMTVAATHGVARQQAIAGELAGRYFLARGRRMLARACLMDAVQAYARWGATPKVNELGAEHADLLPRGLLGRAEGEVAESGAVLDLATVLRASQAISGEIVLEELLRRLMMVVLASAGAQRAVLLLRGDERVVVEATQAADAGAPASVSLHGPASEGGVELPGAIVRYVERTGERVVLGDVATAAGRFAADAYLSRARPKSILCLPVTKQKQRVGTLYLENRTTAGAFTPERSRVLELLAAQAAISIENARLYETLEKRVSDRTQELRESNGELSRALRRLRETQRQLISQEKMAHLGALTAGIAHELKNPLNFVNNFAQVSAHMVDDVRAELVPHRAAIGSGFEDIEATLVDVHENLERIEEHGKRADGIISSMMLHARETGVAHEEADLNALVATGVRLACQGYGSKQQGFAVEVASRLAPDLGPVALAAADIQRVIVNLVLNACWAMDRRRAAEGAGYAPVLEVRTADLQDRVEIRVRDNGIGIAPDVLARVYNPFFTTKQAGEGTGLGLSIAYEIVVNQHHGDIRIESAPGQGAEVVITLPRRAVA